MKAHKQAGMNAKSGEETQFLGKFSKAHLEWQRVFGSFLTEPAVSYARLRTQMRLHVRMSFEEILEELPKLTADEKERLRQLLDYQLSWTEAEEQAIDEGIRSREEGPSKPWEELDGRLRDRFGLK